MKIELDLNLNKELRNKINEQPNFIDEIRSEFAYPSEGRRKDYKDTFAYNCICAALDRINDLVEHCNSIDINNESKEGIFALYDFLNCAQTLIECITKIGKIFDVKYETTGDVSAFHQQGRTGKGNDEKYFKYLRSLCSVHPIDTNAHAEYQGDEPEWCPYITTGKSALYRLLQNQKIDIGDFVAIVYSNDFHYNKHIPIRVKELFFYVEKRYEFIKDICKAVDSYNQKHIREFKNKYIPLPEEYQNYIAYLYELKNALQERYGRNCGYIVRNWIAIMQTVFVDETMQNILQQYQDALKTEIKSIHNNLQQMIYSEEGICFTPFSHAHYEGFEGYSYELEKIGYLYPGDKMENEDYEISQILNEDINFNKEQMQYLLSVVDKAIKHGYSHEQIIALTRVIDNQFKVNNSEWARIQLKIIEFAFEKSKLNFDYMQNDWHLYIQVEIANWLMGRKG